MNIGIISPFNPQSIADYLNEKDIPQINNSATAVNTLVYEFLEQGYHLKIFTVYDNYCREYKIIRGKNVEVYLIPKGILPSYIDFKHCFLTSTLYLPNRIADVVKREVSMLDVLHAHWTYEYARAATFFSKKIPVFITVRDWCPYILSVQKGIKRKLSWMIKYHIFKQVMADERVVFIANSLYTHQMITKAYPHKNVPVIPNPIDKNWIVEKKSACNEHQIISIAKGLHDRRKNITLLLTAFSLYHKKYPEAKLHLVGNYSSHEAMFIEWKQKGLLNDVVFYGELPHNDLVALLDKMSFMVHASLEETFGNILLEAMSRGVPCVGGAESGAVPEVLGYGKYGIMCNVEDSQSIYEAMERMNDQQTYQRYVASCHSMLLQNYSSDIVVKRHIDLFNS